MREHGFNVYYSECGTQLKLHTHAAVEPKVAEGNEFLKSVKFSVAKATNNIQIYVAGQSGGYQIVLGIKKSFNGLRSEIRNGHYGVALSSISNTMEQFNEVNTTN